MYKFFTLFLSSGDVYDKSILVVPLGKLLTVKKVSLLIIMGKLQRQGKQSEIPSMEVQQHKCFFLTS